MVLALYENQVEQENIEASSFRHVSDRIFLNDCPFLERVTILIEIPSFGPLTLLPDKSNNLRYDNLMKLTTLETVFNTFNQAKVRYLVAGGIAVNTHGYQRMTSDLDLVIQLDSDNIKKAMHNLDKLGYVPIIPIKAVDFADPDKRKHWIEAKNMQVLSLQSNQYPETTIDIFVTEPFDFDEEYKISTSAEITPEISFNIVSIPTLIEMKIRANRIRDLDDIQHLELILVENNGK